MISEPSTHKTSSGAKSAAEEPPSYYSSTGPSTSGSYPHPSMQVAPAPFSGAVNHLALKTRKDPIAGVFHIDPMLAPLVPPLGKKQKKQKKKQRAAPHATFETRQGAIALALSIVGEGAGIRSTVDVKTRQGPVDISVHSIAPNRTLYLRVETRSGDICVLLPRSFSGPAHVRTRKGRVTLLPGLACASAPISSIGEDRFLLVGAQAAQGMIPPNTNVASASAWIGDYLVLDSVKGDICLGIQGLDQKPEQGGFWKKLGEFVTGEIFGTKRM